MTRSKQQTGPVSVIWDFGIYVSKFLQRAMISQTKWITRTDFSSQAVKSSEAS